MVKLLMIADDFTGALDTGIQFAKRGAVTEVYTDPDVELRNTKADIVVIDAETRHMSGPKAFHTVKLLLHRAFEAGIPYIYKKTDSALRGNVGAELAAMCSTDQGRVHFVPAYPKMNRTTKNGIQYISGVPLAKSVFGSDPFEPMLSSSIPEIIAKETKEKVTLVPGGIEPAFTSHGIYLYDAESDQDLRRIARTLSDSMELHYTAGCAGFANAIADVIRLSDHPKPLPAVPSDVLCVIGSVNPVTVRQMDTAEKKGMKRIHFDAAMRLDATWAESPEAEKTIHSWLSTLQDEGALILDANAKGAATDTISPENRETIARNIGSIVRRIFKEKPDVTWLFSGGDTLHGSMDAVGIKRIQPIMELMPGAVLSSIEYEGKTVYCISKSGGFGEENLITELHELLKEQGENV